MSNGKLFTCNPLENLLPYDGVVNYYGSILNESQSSYYFNKLLNSIEWRNDQTIIFGKCILTKRKVAWYGDQHFSYTYSKKEKIALIWNKDLLELKEFVEYVTGASFNSCLLNLYGSGDEGMAWHSDNERELGVDPVIASLSLGAERTFSFKHKTSKQKVDLPLACGSLLVMKGATQAHWLHALPKTKKITNPRINLTFRTIVS